MDISSLGRFHIAPGYDPAAPETWVWEDRSADVRHVGGGVTITGGRADEVSEVDAGTASLEVDNAGGHYCTENPLGRWYGLLSRNTPARWGTICGAEAWTVNTSNGWGVPDVGLSWVLNDVASSWSSSGGVGQLSQSTVNVFHTAMLVGGDARDGEAVFTCSVPAVATGASLVAGFLARRDASGMGVWFCIDFGLAGVLGARIKRVIGGFSTDLGGTPTVGSYTPGQRIRARCVWDGQDLRMRVWPESGTEPTTWSAVGTDSQCTGAGVGLQFWRVSGNTNTSPVVYSVDDLEIEAVEIVGTVPAWPVRWDDTGQVSWSPIQIAGINRRLAQGQAPLRSPIYRQLIAQPGCGYWPFEDGSDSLTASSALSGGQAARCLDVTFGSSDCPPGSAAAAILTSSATSSIAGKISSWTVPQDGYAAMMYVRQPSLSAVNSPVVGNRLMLLDTVGTVARWVFYAGATSFFLEGYQADGTLLVSPGAIAFTVDPTKWYAIQLETQESGGTVTWALIFHQVGSTSFTAISNSYAGTADRITRQVAYAPVDGTLVCHLWSGDDLLPFAAVVFMKVSYGYSGELASNRIARLCAEEGIQVTVEPGNSEPLGPQRVGTLPDLLRSAEAADMGVLYERGAGLGYRPRSARYNAAVDLTLAIAVDGDISDAPEPTNDDQRVRNEWTVGREGGGQATASDPAHIAKNGRYPDTATINIQTDDRLPDHANWRVHLGTWGEYRWPLITLQLTDDPAQLAAWRGRRFGPRITVSGVPSQGPIGADLSLIVEGWTQEITSASWVVHLACSPARPWDVGALDGGVARYDSASTTLGSSVSSSATQIAFSVAARGDVWWTMGTYGVLIAGEQITVVWMSSVGSIAALEGGFETGMAGWTPNGFLGVQSSAFAHVGTYSCQLTVTGSPGTASIFPATQWPVTVGASYTATAWVYATSSISNVRISISWYTSGGAFVSASNGSTITLGSGVWTQITVQATAPATGVLARPIPQIFGSPANGTVMYVDDIDMVADAAGISSAGPYVQQAWVTRAVNGIAKALTAGAEIHVATPGRYAL